MTEEIEFQDSSTPEEVVEEVNDDTPTLEDYQKLAETKKQISARLAKAEAELKKFKTQTKGDENLKTNTQNSLSREEAILFAKGLTEDEIELAAKIAQVNGTSLVKATEDEFFQSKLLARQAEERSRAAQLGASAGGQAYIPTNLSDEEHEAQARKILANL